jgi:hypothetical protein
MDVPIIGTSQKNGTGKNDEADGSLKWVNWNVWEGFWSQEMAAGRGNFCASPVRNDCNSIWIILLC